MKHRRKSKGIKLVEHGVVGVAFLLGNDDICKDRSLRRIGAGLVKEQAKFVVLGLPSVRFKSHTMDLAYIDVYSLHSIELEENVSKRSYVIHPFYKPTFFV
jgi:hypothetical protein